MEDVIQWMPAHDARTLPAKWRSRCINCDEYSEPGEMITGTRRDGWACQACVDVAGENRRQPDWALPVGARQNFMKWNTKCCLCGQELLKGAPSWRNICGGDVCRVCKVAIPPTYGGVLEKIAVRIHKGVPVNLTLDDIGTLALHLQKRTALVPARLGTQEAWNARGDEEPSEIAHMFERVRSLEEAYGILLDAVEHRFNPNLRSNWLLALIGTIEDPAAEDPSWDEVLRRRNASFGRALG